MRPVSYTHLDVYKRQVYLFGGLMQLPSGYTYARYAREGFFQLLFVCILNVIIVLLGDVYKRQVLMLFLTVWIIIMFFTDYMNSQSVKLYCMFVVGCGRCV